MFLPPRLLVTAAGAQADKMWSNSNLLNCFPLCFANYGRALLLWSWNSLTWTLILLSKQIFYLELSSDETVLALKTVVLDFFFNIEINAKYPIVQHKSTLLNN